MKVTAETITDEQIRRLRGELSDRDPKFLRDAVARALRIVERKGSNRARMAARERCATAWNSRHGDEP